MWEAMWEAMWESTWEATSTCSLVGGCGTLICISTKVACAPAPVSSRLHRCGASCRAGLFAQVVIQRCAFSLQDPP